MRPPGRLATALLTAPFVAAFAGLAAATWLLAWSFVGTPFPGFLPLAHGHVDGLLLRDWPGQKAGVEPYTWVEAIDGRPVAGGRAIYARLAERPAGPPPRYRLRGPDGRARELAIPARPFTAVDFAGAFLAFWIAGLAFVVVGWAVLLARPAHPSAWAHWWFCLAIGGMLVANFEAGSTGVLPAWFVPAATVLVAPAFAALGATFPRPALGPRGLTALTAGVMMLVAASVGGLWGADPAAWASALLACLVLTLLALAGALARWSWLAASRRAPRPLRAQAGVALTGLGAAFLPNAVVGVIAPLLGAGAPGLGLTELAFAAFPLAMAFAILRHGAFDFGPAARGLALDGGLLAAFAAAFVAVATAGAAVGGAAAQLAPFVAALATSMAFGPTRAALRRTLERVFRGERVASLRALAAATGRAEAGPQAIATELAAQVAQLLGPTWAAVWVAGERLAAVGPAPLGADAAAALAVPLPLAGGVEARLAIGPRATGERHGAVEHEALSLLAAHAATALDHVRLRDERLALRVREGVARAVAAERARLIADLVAELRREVLAIRLAAEAGLAAGPAGEAQAGQAPDDPEDVLARIATAARRMDARIDAQAGRIEDGPASASSGSMPAPPGMSDSATTDE